MQWNIIVGPILGAVIGYVTNKIAVEMLFRPLNPIYIGKIHVPFTPGIIPKGKERLGKAIGDTVANSLLTPAIIKDTLLTEEIENEIVSQIDLMFHNLSYDHSTLESKIQFFIGETATTRLNTQIVEVITKKINYGLKTMNLGELVADEVVQAVQDKVQGTMFAMFLKPATIAPITDEIKVRVDQYINDHGEEIVKRFIEEEYTNVKDQSVSTFMQSLNITDLKHICLTIYRMIVNNYAEKFLSTLNLSKIVEEKICAMNTKEVEKLVLSIMEKELGAVVNLGAVIGFVLGLFNLLF